VANSIADSTGGVAHLPISPETSLARAQRVLSRRKRGSNRYAKQRLRVARLKAKQARIRKDWIHRTTTDIARHYGHVVLEDLNTKGMTAKGRGKRGLNRSILEQGWAMFATMLAYKLEERGGTLEFVNPAYTSQTCAECGMVDSRSRKSQATFECVHCGHADHADINAAKNILRRSTAFMRVEGRQWPPGETRTIPNLAAVAVGGC
jgi:putative transposase